MDVGNEKEKGFVLSICLISKLPYLIVEGKKKKFKVELDNEGWCAGRQ